MQPVCFAIRVIRVIRDNPRFRSSTKLRLTNGVRPWYDLITEEIHIVGKETK